MKSSKMNVIPIIMCLFTAAVIAGCGARQDDPITARVKPGNGEVSARVSFSGGSAHRAYMAKRQADRSAEQASSGIVVVDIEISGYYSLDNVQFETVTAQLEIDAVQGHGRAVVAQVPIGRNHLLTAMATWPDGATETVKCLIPEVSEGAVTTAAANEVSTVVAEAAILHVTRRRTTLSMLSQSAVEAIEAAVEELAASGVAYSDMTADAVYNYADVDDMIKQMEIEPETAYVLKGGTQQFTARVYDHSGIEKTNADVRIWEVEPRRLGNMNPEGLFVASTENTGEGTVTASRLSLSAQATVIVVSTLVEAAVSPESGDTTGVYTITCTPSGDTPSVVEARCNNSGDWTEIDTGNTMDCEYSAAGAYIPECRVDGLAVDNVDDPLVITEYAEVCGNEIVDSTEDCDEGTANGTVCSAAYGETCTYCGSACLTVTVDGSSCGDGAVDSGNSEQCDSGANNGTACTPAYGSTCDYCDASCQAVTLTGSTCGDGTVDTSDSETCDDGASNGQPNQCNSTCDGTTSATCGNGTVESGETCDDGNAVNTDVCLDTCAAASCGDSYIQSGVETCDDGNTTTETCAYGETSCTVCDSACASVAGATSYCGDTTTDSGNSEICDDGNTATETCAYGQTSCTVCDSVCANVAGATSYCGDSTTDSGNSETCDDGNAATETCAYGETSCTVCDSVCASVAGATSFCGDSTTDSGNGETCDDGANNGQPAYCNSSCDGATPSTCGNSTVEAGEDCDAGAESPTCNSDCTTAACGDNVYNSSAGEACDDGNTVTETCTYGETSCTVCDSVCASVAGATSYCGDSSTDGTNGETCDDSNAVTEECAYGETSCTVCDSVCASVAGATSYCGDSSTDGTNGETCDDGNAVTEECAYGETSCTVCDSVCADVAGATSYCGDSSTDGTNGETCDDGNAVTEACAYGETSCTVCDSVCASVAGATSYCGDSSTDGTNGETCDDGNAVTEECAYGETSCTVCDSVCADVAGATSYCGDGSTDGTNGETCDDGANNGQPLYCNSTCDGDTPAVCGNSVVESGAGYSFEILLLDANLGSESAMVASALTFASGQQIMVGYIDGSYAMHYSEIKTITDIDVGLGTITFTPPMEKTVLISDPITTYFGVAKLLLGEECDDGNTVTETCSYGQTSCTVCNEICGSVDGATSYCGDSSTDGTNGEACDDGNAVTEECTYGETSCTVCDSVCADVAGATSFCGDSSTDGTNGETCDDGNAVTEECAYGETSCTVCDSACASVAGATSYCGDSSTDGTNGETCDDGNTTSGDGCFSTCLTEVVSIESSRLWTGSSHACFITDAGGVKCWGNNGSGQLGNATTDSYKLPADVSGLSSGVASLTAGFSHTCALLDTGGVKCWGENGNRQLGDGTTTDSSIPVDVSGLSSGVAGVGGGEYHTCALMTTGNVKCWGRNTYGQLGDGTTTTSSTPVDSSALSFTAVAIGVGSEHNCALTDTGGVKCWGMNNYGQLGNATTTNSTIPVDVSGLTSGVAAIDAGDNYTCALLDTGGEKCWGYNGYGQLGDGTNTSSSTPVDVSGLSSGVAKIWAGFNHTCALQDTGGVKCWGRNNIGQLGDGTITDSYIPVDVSGLSSGIVEISASIFTTCALEDTGDVKCLGSYAALGNGSRSNTKVAEVVTMDNGPFAGVTDVSVGTFHVCAVGSGGAKCWGQNSDGPLGDGTVIGKYIPVDVSGLTSGVAAMSAGYSISCALLDTGGVKCWGDNYYGEVGDGTTTDRNIPVDVSGLSSGVAAANATGGKHVCALLDTGGLKCWGYNGSGQLGDGTSTDRYTPVDVSGHTSGVAAVSPGEYHTCALLTTGGAKCWGRNTNGQLGDGTTTNNPISVNVSGLTSGIAEVSAGSFHSCALLDTGGVKCWGQNTYGQVGDGTTTDSTIPVNVSGLSSGVAAIDAGSGHSCALLSTGGVKCWGYNGSGQLGDASTTDSSIPVDVSGLSSGVVKISVGYDATCALLDTGEIKCWGNYNLVGDGTGTGSTIPSTVITGL